MSFANQVNGHTLLSPGTATQSRIGVADRENEQLRLIVDELGHRFKNLVGMVQSIARQTMHQATSKEDFEVRFSGRLEALGRSVDRLLANEQQGVRIDELVRSELTAFGLLDGAQISVNGPALGVNPAAARSIGLTLHELATNASKYGALSVPEGKVAVHWELANSGAQRRFLMTWRESGGPIVTEPKRRGFGRRVIEQSTSQALAGEVTHEFLPGGVRWTLAIPAAFVVSAQMEPSSACWRVRTGRDERNQHLRQ